MTMITKETARRIYNCHQQLETIAKTKQDMLEEIERIREKQENTKEPIPEKGSFGKYGRGMQLGIPDSNGYSSMRIFDISPEIGVLAMDEQTKKLQKELRELETIAKLEMEGGIK